MASYQYIFVMQNLTKVLPGGRELFKNITLSFFPGAKIGVLGVNGAGKSTLLKIMAGIDKDFSGEAWAADGVKIGYLEQEPQLDPNKNVMQNVMDGLGETRDLLQRFEEVSAKFAEPMTDEEMKRSYERYKQWHVNKSHYRSECIAYVMMLGIGAFLLSKTGKVFLLV